MKKQPQHGTCPSQESLLFLSVRITIHLETVMNDDKGHSHEVLIYHAIILKPSMHTRTCSRSFLQQSKTYDITSTSNVENTFLLSQALCFNMSIILMVLKEVEHQNNMTCFVACPITQPTKCRVHDMVAITMKHQDYNSF